MGMRKKLLIGFRRAAENGNIVCAHNYALTLSDPHQQLHWFYKAAFKGLPEAQREVGRILYEMGDSSNAQRWFELAIRRENVTALNDMGVMLWQADQIEKALEYWHRAAELGNEDATTNLEIAASESIYVDEYTDNNFDDSDSEYPHPLGQSHESARVQEVNPEPKRRLGRH
jgi:TPR repeat protein